MTTQHVVTGYRNAAKIIHRSPARVKYAMEHESLPYIPKKPGERADQFLVESLLEWMRKQEITKGMSNVAKEIYMGFYE